MRTLKSRNKRVAEISCDKVDGVLVHRKVTPGIKLASTHSYTWVKRGTVRVKCLAQEHNTVPRPGLEPRPLDPKSNALTIRPPSVNLEWINASLWKCTSHVRQLVTATAIEFSRFTNGWVIWTKEMFYFVKIVLFHTYLYVLVLLVSASLRIRHCSLRKKMSDSFQPENKNCEAYLAIRYVRVAIWMTLFGERTQWVHENEVYASFLNWGKWQLGDGLFTQN